MIPLAAARALATWWPAQYVSPTGLATCLEMTRYAVEAFHAAGVDDVEPMACALTIYNPAATIAMLSGTEPTHSATKLEISPEAATRAGLRRIYPAHLVAEHPEFLLDLTLGAVVRALGTPIGLEHVGPIAVEKNVEAVFVGGAWTSVSSEGIAVRWEPRPRLRAWRKAEAWCGELDAETVELIADSLRGSELEGIEP